MLHRLTDLQATGGEPRAVAGEATAADVPTAADAPTSSSAAAAAAQPRAALAGMDVDAAVVGPGPGGQKRGSSEIAVCTGGAGSPMPTQAAGGGNPQRSLDDASDEGPDEKFQCLGAVSLQDTPDYSTLENLD